MFDHDPDLAMTRKSDVWSGARSAADIRGAAERTETAARHGGHTGWGLQQKGLEWRARRLMDVLPDARIVHMLRDPVTLGDDTGWSAARRGWALAVWAESTHRAVALAERHPDSYLIVQSESFARDPRQTYATVRRFVGLPECPTSVYDTVSWAAFAPLERGVVSGVDRLVARARRASGYGPADGESWRLGDAVGVIAYFAGRIWMMTGRWIK